MMDLPHCSDGSLAAGVSGVSGHFRLFWSEF